MELSEEQQHILDVTKTGVNVVVDAVAGTGKQHWFYQLQMNCQIRKFYKWHIINHWSLKYERN